MIFNSFHRFHFLNPIVWTKSVFFCTIALFWAACQHPASTLVMHTEMGDIRLKIKGRLPSDLYQPLQQMLETATDSLAIGKVLHDGYVQLNYQTALPPVAGPSDLPLSGTFVWHEGFFYLVQGREQTDASLDKWERLTGEKLTEEARSQYKKHGGALQLHGAAQLLGHLTEGKEVLDRIAALPHDQLGYPLRKVGVHVFSK
jgi:hypothetical protein